MSTRPPLFDFRPFHDGRVPVTTGAYSREASSPSSDAPFEGIGEHRAAGGVCSQYLPHCPYQTIVRRGPWNVTIPKSGPLFR